MIDQDFDATCDAWLSADEAFALESEDHLMDRWRRDAEVSLHVGFGWRAPEHQGIGVDEGQILTLLRREADTGSGSTLVRHLIHLLSPQPLGPPMNVRYRVELSQTEREELTELLSGGKQAARS